MKRYLLPLASAAMLGCALLMTPASRAGERPVTPDWNLASRGADTSGHEDCTVLVQQVLDEAGKAGGGVVAAPAGRYRINGNLRIPANVTLQGIYRSAPNPMRSGNTNLSGTVFLAFAGRGASNGPAFLQLAGHNAGVAGLIVTYPEWKQTDVPPVPYPPCVASQDTENIAIQDCCFLNPYEAIRLVRAHRHLARNITGYPIWRGLYVDECYDIGRVENIHFWPFGVSYDQENPFCKWVNTQGVAFEFARTDWHYVANTFCFGYGIGYKFSESKHGSANGNFLGLGADSCQRAVVVQQAQPPGLLISNGEFVGRWGSTNAVCLEIAPGVQGKVSLVNCSFWGPIDRCVWLRSATAQFTASACHFVHWDNRGLGSPALQFDAGRAIVQGCTFAQDNLAVAVGSNVISAILTANQAVGGFRITNQAGQRTQMSINEPDPITWTPEALSHYRLNIGAGGDGRYLQGFHEAEKTDRRFRWSLGPAYLNLPVVPEKKTTLTLEFHLPKQALAPDSGLYFNGQRLARLDEGNTVKAVFTAEKEDRARLELRCQPWVPKQVVTGSQDARTLGIQLFQIIVQAEDSQAPLFDANTGKRPAAP